MSDAVTLEVEDLIAQADALPYGDGRVALLEEAVRHADGHAEVEAGYQARMELLDAAIMTGRGDLLIAHYPWCLAQFDRDPDRFDEFELLWRFKWVMDRVPSFADISLDQVRGLQDEMAERFRKVGMGGRAVADARLSFAMHRGDRADAERYYQEYREQPRDALSDCSACEADTEVKYHVWRGDDATAVRAARPILRGRLSCRSVPESTYATLLEPFLRLKKDEQAVAAHQQGLPLCTRPPDVGNLAKHLGFLAMTDNLSAAARLFEKHLPHALAAAEPLERFDFLLAGRFLCDRLATTDWRRGLRVPPALASGDRKASADVPTLRGWIDGQCAAIAARFDARNGTSLFADRIAEQAGRHAMARPVLLT